METDSNVLAYAVFTAFWDFTEAGAELMQETVIVINVIILHGHLYITVSFVCDILPLTVKRF